MEKTNWEKLEKFLSDYRYKGKVSVSGGGDCLYRYKDYTEWWSRFFGITKKLNLLVDIHTREKFVNDSFWINQVNRCVFSFDRLIDDIDHLKYLSGLTKIRIAHLVTAETTFKIIDEYLSFQREHGCQFTIKELIGFDDEGRYKQIRSKYPDIFHLDAGDYNIYYMPNNTISDKFIF